MKPFTVAVCLALLLLLPAGIASAASPTATPPAATTTTPDRSGGSISFETDPTGATIWVDSVEIGTSDFTYYSAGTGTFGVQVRKKGYEDYTDTVTVRNGERVVFYARLTPISPDIPAEKPSAAPVPTATTIRKLTMKIPTPWPAATPESPADPVVIIGATAGAVGFAAIRRR